MAKVKIVFEKKEMEKIKLSTLCLWVKKLNMNKNIEAHIKKCGDKYVEVVISKKNELRDICESMGIKHFDNKEDWIKWMKENGRTTK